MNVQIKENQACFLAPIHSPKFDYGLNFIKSYNRFYSDNHIFLVFSSQDERHQFDQLAKGLRYQSIVYDNPKSTGIITEKKYHGLRYIFNFTNIINVGVVDVDTDFFKTVDYSDLFVKYYQRGTLWGNAYDFCPTPMAEGPLRFFNDEDRKKLIEITSNCRAYFWFNDVPVYNRTHFLNYLKYINYNQRCKELTWFDFDFIPYGYYLLAKGYFKLLPFEVENGKFLNNIFIEDQYLIDPPVFEKLFALSKPMWIKKDIDEKLMENTFMHLHLDRPPGA